MSSAASRWLHLASAWQLIPAIGPAATVLTVICLIVATIMGHHFQIGFIWDSSGAGWEYPVLWSALIFSFVLGGERWLSLDDVIGAHMTLPEWVKSLMGDTVSHTRTKLEN